MKSFICCFVFSIAVVFFCPAATLLSQVVSAPSNLNTYTAEPIVIESSETVVDMKADGTGICTGSITAVIHSEAALRTLGVVGIPFASATQRAEFIYVRVRHPDNTVTETPLDGLQEQAAEATREAPFYSDIRQKQLPVRGLHVGDTLEWKFRVTIFKSEAPNQFWGSMAFVRDGIILAQSIELHVPSAVHATVWTNPKSGVKPEESTADGEHIYRWFWKNLAPTAGPEAEAAAKVKKTKLLSVDEELDQTQGHLPDIAWTTFPSWAAVGTWYRSLEADRIQPNDAIKAKVAEIVAGKISQEDKVRAVYSWVSENIRYIGVAFGVGRFQPHNASEVLDNGYGDCKDKHTLLASMLSVLGLHPEAVLVGAGVRFNDSIPSAASFNHVITRVRVDDKDIWLDSTVGALPYRVLSPATRDREALVVPMDSAPSIERTPAVYPYPAFSSMTTVGSLDGDFTSDSKITLTYRDDDEISFRIALQQVSATHYREFVQRFLQGMGFGGTVSEVEIDHANDLSQPIAISFHYHRNKGENWGENRITAMFQYIYLPPIDDQNPAVASIQLGIPRTETSTVEMKLPAGWTAEVPEAIRAHTPYVTCDVTYRVDNGILYGQRRLTVLREKIPVTQWKQYKSWYEEAGVSGIPFIQLERTGMLLPGIDPALIKPVNP